MKNEITVKDAGLLQVIEDRTLGEIIKPLVNEIHLFDTYIAGTSYLPDQSVLQQLQAGDKLHLQREVNKFDDQAIVILNSDNVKLGYVPEKDNTVFSRLMDAGKLLTARVDSVDRSYSFHKIRIGIYLVDY